MIEQLTEKLNTDGVVILPPMDVLDAIELLNGAGVKVSTTILDPWYNKGFGGVIPDTEYDAFIQKLLGGCAEFSNTMYLWGFPEIIGPYVRYAPEGFRMSAWLTWYYKNCPSVIRGWRPSQNACIEFIKEGCRLYPEHFLNEEQKQKYESKKMRFVPGPSAVIEEPLICGFIGKKERTGHPSQKPERVFERLILMSSKEDDVIFDPMAGSGTTAAVAQKLGRKAIVCDGNDEFIQMIEKRTGINRIII